MTFNFSQPANSGHKKFYNGTEEISVRIDHDGDVIMTDAQIAPATGFSFGSTPFTFGTPQAAKLTKQINLNTATIDELTRIPHITQQHARLITQLRPFFTISDIQKKLADITHEKFIQMRYSICV
jgi:DNA uptake protein ComE-like DNA-binding protein